MGTATGRGPLSNLEEAQLANKKLGMAGHGGRKTKAAARSAMLESPQRVRVAACMETVTPPA